MLDESPELLRAARGVLICVTHHGFVCANAGVDASNAPGPDTLVLLPLDPDASARRSVPGSPAASACARGGDHRLVRARLAPRRSATSRSAAPGSIPSRTGGGAQTAPDASCTRPRSRSPIELAAAADLARAKDGSQPVVIVRGAGPHVTEEDGPGAAAIVRPEAEDLFR